MRWTPSAWLLALALAAFAAPGALAHPHVTIEQRLTLVFDAKGLDGVNVQWSFDDMYSEAAAGDYDKNHNGKLEPNEAALVKRDLFAPILRQGGFVFIRVDGAKRKVSTVSNFSASLKDGLLSLEFFIPCQTPVGKATRKLVVDTYDPTYYNDIVFCDINPVSLRNAKAFEAKTTVWEDTGVSYYFNQVHPWALVAELRGKP